MDLLEAFEGRVSDVTFAAQGGVVRAAMSLGEAIRTAIEDVESLPGVRVVRVEPEDHVAQGVVALWRWSEVATWAR